MKNYKTILLDVDGTLLDFRASEKEAFERLFSKYGYVLNAATKEIYDRINHSLWNQYEQGKIGRIEVINTRFVRLFEEVGIVGDGVQFEKEYQELLAEGHSLINGARELLEYLYDKYDLYIVTNGITTTQFKRLKDSKLDIFVKDIFVSEATGYQKPMKEYFDYCFDRIENLELAKTLIIGDSLSSDMKGGKNAKIATCWYNPDYIAGNANIPVDYEIRDLRELYKIL